MALNGIVAWGTLEEAKILLEEPNTLQDVLFSAVVHNNAEVLRYTIGQGADIDFGFDEGTIYPLKAALYNGHLETAQILMEAGAKIVSSDAYAWDDFVETRNLQLFRLYHDYVGGAPEARLDSLYIRIISLNQLEMLKYLLHQGYAAQDALINACGRNRKDCVAAILELGNLQGLTSDMQVYCVVNAVSGGDYDIVEMIYNTGADFTGIKPDNYCAGSAFADAIYCGNLDAVQFLLEKGWDANEKCYIAGDDAKDLNDTPTTNHMDYPIIYTAGSSVRMLELLVKGGADLNVQSETFDNLTPLMIAISSNRYMNVKLLLDNGAEILTLRNARKQNALETAQSLNTDEKPRDPRIMRALEEAAVQQEKALTLLRVGR